METPGIEQETFTLKFADNKSNFKSGDVICCGVLVHAKVTSPPKRKWYKLLCQIITLGLYKAKWYYKLQLMQCENGQTNESF